MEKCFYSGRRNAVIMKQDMGGKEYEKENGEIELTDEEIIGE